MKQSKDDKRKTFQALTFVTQLGLVMIVAIGMTTALGVWLDRTLGTSWITVVLFFLGAVGGGQSVYRMISQFDRDEEDGNDETSEKS